MTELAGVRFDTASDGVKTESAMDLGDIWLGEPIADMLDAIPDPKLYYMYVTQINIKRKVGSIILPQTAVDDQRWTSGLGLVVKVGPSSYKGRRFADLGLTEEDGFKPGDVVNFDAGTVPRPIYVDNRLFLCISDDMVRSTVKREHIHRIKFTI